MTVWRSRLQQIGGRNAISRWSWIITIPLAILVSSTYAESPSLAEVLTWQSIVLGVHCLLGFLMWVAWKTVLPATDRASHPVTALVFFGLLGLTRGLLMQLAQEIVGISGGVFSERLAVNVAGSIVALSAIAVIVDDYRTDEAIVQRLARARVTLSTLLDREAATLRAADIEVLTQVQERVTQELGAAGASPERIRVVADEIVRPISHELADQATEPKVLDIDESGPEVRLTFTQAFGRMVAPSPLALVIVVEGTIFGAVAARYGLPVALGNVVLGGGLILIGCWLIQRFLPLPQHPIGRLALLAVALAGVGAAATELTSLVITPLSATFPAGLIGVSGGVAAAGVALSLWAAVNAGRQLRQQEMAEAVGQEAAAIDRMREIIEQRRLQAARFLHGTIQGELVAAALRQDNAADVSEVISRRFAEYGSLPQRSAQQQVLDVVSAWSSVLAITFHVDDEVWDVISSQTERINLLVDALSESLTNVVRHASDKHVDIDIVLQGRMVALKVSSLGGSGSVASPGIGLAQLRARGAGVRLDAEGDRVRLIVSL